MRSPTSACATSTCPAPPSASGGRSTGNVIRCRSGAAPTRSDETVPAPAPRVADGDLHRLAVAGRAAGLHPFRLGTVPADGSVPGRVLLEPPVLARRRGGRLRRPADAGLGADRQDRHL